MYLQQKKKSNAIFFFFTFPIERQDFQFMHLAFWGGGECT